MLQKQQWKEELLELVTLTQRHLLEEYTPRERLFCGESSFAFYRPSSEEKRPSQPEREPPKVELQKIAIPKVESRRETPPPPPPPQPKEAIKTEEPKQKREEKKEIELHPMGEAPEPNLESIKGVIEKALPGTLCNTPPPNDSKVKLLSLKWRKNSKPPEIVILTFDEDHKCRTFLSNVAEAIRQLLAPAAVYSAPKIESKRAWRDLFSKEELKLIICSDYGLYALPGLMQHYRQSPSGQQHYLGGIQTLLLSDPALYMQKPELKSALWRALVATKKCIDDGQ